jgi:hypothetical protein
MEFGAGALKQAGRPIGGEFWLVISHSPEAAAAWVTRLGRISLYWRSARRDSCTSRRGRLVRGGIKVVDGRELCDERFESDCDGSPVCSRTNMAGQHEPRFRPLPTHHTTPHQLRVSVRNGPSFHARAEEAEGKQGASQLPGELGGEWEEMAMLRRSTLGAAWVSLNTD